MTKTAEENPGFLGWYQAIQVNSVPGPMGGRFGLDLIQLDAAHAKEYLTYLLYS